MSTRRERARKRAGWVRDAEGIPKPLCPNGCGEPGPHFVPPSLGDRGFYICERKGRVVTRLVAFVERWHARRVRRWLMRRYRPWL